MIDISISSTKVRGRPKGRPNPFAGCGEAQIRYPEKVRVNELVWSIRKYEGLIYRNANGGIEKRGKQRYEPDLWE